MRWVVATLLGAGLLLTPATSHAQIAEKILKCQRSIKLTIACVVVDQGVEKIVEVGLQTLIDLALKRRKKIEPDPNAKVSPEVARDLHEHGIEWSKLEDFLVSVANAGTPVDEAELRSAIGSACASNYHQVCAYHGFAKPQRQTVDCAFIKSQTDCDTLMTSCTWTGSACAPLRGR